MRSSNSALLSAGKPDYAAAFASALLDPTRGVPKGVEGARHGAATKRFNVYRNNVTVSLIEALGAIYPAVRRITGPDFFRAMARSHIRVSPPNSPLLFDYGREFPAFIEGYAYAQSTLWLADVARVERAWLDCCHAADAAPLTAATLGAVAPERLGHLVFKPHPAVRLLRSRYAAASIFAAWRDEAAQCSLEANGAEDVLIARPSDEVIVRRLPDGGATFLMRLLAGDCLGGAVETAAEEAPGFDLPAIIEGILAAGVFTAISEEVS
jgi:hypothetical protein